MYFLLLKSQTQMKGTEHSLYMKYNYLQRNVATHQALKGTRILSLTTFESILDLILQHEIFQITLFLYVRALNWDVKITFHFKIKQNDCRMIFIHNLN